ncbi:unnamed protein product [Rotaria socialis]|uniref:Uncharacterized protein n=1 Tax=Rotaria socialis TaxID=392032 RepID=A0A821UAU7_9BILA|nr:unnamed protein product [Rotaria socialis]CAF4886856.1 unnamed protein product [Rotaria socialis]
MLSSQSTSFPLQNVDVVVKNGISILELIESVKENLRDEHRIVILVAFYGDITCIVKQPIPGNVFASLVKGLPEHPATKVLELASIAHAEWQSSRSDRLIIWTLPYYVDLACYNCYRLRSPLSEEIYDMSLDSSQKGNDRGKGRGRGRVVAPYTAKRPELAPSTASLSVAHPPTAMQSFYQGFPPALLAPPPSVPYNAPSSELIEELDTDRYGNTSWKALPPATSNPLGHINFSIPHEWSWASHLKEIKRVQGQCATASLAHQTMVRTQACTLIRERALQEMRTGLNSSFNASSTTYGHRLMYGISYPVAKHQDAEQDLRSLIRPQGIPDVQPTTPHASAPGPSYYYPAAP